MKDIEFIIKRFYSQNGILKTSELKQLGLSSRQIKKLLEEGVISKIKTGYYELVEAMVTEEAIISKLFPEAVVFLESALFYYGYTDRIPRAWQLAVDKHGEKSIYKIDYPQVEPYYLEKKLLDIGLTSAQMNGIEVRIFDRERTICDVLRYEKKMEREVFSNAIQRYLKDSNKNIRTLLEYGNVFNISNKIQTYIGVWL
ncbi:type IV toxin-antitoxin system AbiEi family antitoxin domain-containing protein [Fusibacter bizertensis]